MHNNMENSEKPHEHINHEKTDETWNSLREEGEGKGTTSKFESGSFSEEDAKALKYKQMSVLLTIAGMALQESTQMETTVEEVSADEEEESEWEEDSEEWEDSDYAVAFENNKEEQKLDTISSEPEKINSTEPGNNTQNIIQNIHKNNNLTNTFYNEENISNNTNVHTNNLINNITHSITKDNKDNELEIDPINQDEGGNHLDPLDLEFKRIFNWGYTDVIKHINGGITIHETQRTVLDMRIYFETKNYSQRIFIEELNKKKEQKVAEEEKNTIELTEIEQIEIIEGVAEPQQIDYTVKPIIKDKKLKDINEKELKVINEEKLKDINENVTTQKKEIIQPKKSTKKTEKIIKSATIKHKSKPKERTTYDSFFWFNCNVNF